MDWRETMQRMLVRMEEAGQWPAVCEEARAVLEAENEPSREPAAYLWGGCLWRHEQCALISAPSIEAARAMGEKGGAVVEDERIAFEAWMRGHNWTLCVKWNGVTYRCDTETGGRVCQDAIRTRQIWAAWRDRAALARNG